MLPSLPAENLLMGSKYGLSYSVLCQRRTIWQIRGRLVISRQAGDTCCPIQRRDAHNSTQPSISTTVEHLEPGWSDGSWVSADTVYWKLETYQRRASNLVSEWNTAAFRGWLN